MNFIAKVTEENNGAVDLKATSRVMEPHSRLKEETHNQIYQSINQSNTKDNCTALYL